MVLAAFVACGGGSKSADSGAGGDPMNGGAGGAGGTGGVVIGTGGASAGAGGTAIGTGGSATGTGGSTSALPIILSFTATPANLAAPGSATLAWQVANASSLSIDQGIGTVSGTSTVASVAATRSVTNRFVPS